MESAGDPKRNSHHEYPAEPLLMPWHLRPTTCHLLFYSFAAIPSVFIFLYK